MVKHEIKKLTHYEYWPAWLFYTPVITPYMLWNCLKAGSMTYYTTANPAIRFGGLFNYSKFKIQEKITEEFRPKHAFISSENRNNIELPFSFPFIAKPDSGERGKNVQLINNQNEWDIYIKNNSSNIILQEFIHLPFEYGVFYAKYPNEEKGKILSITGKNFLIYKGDGKTSLREFIESDSRAYFNKSYLYMKFHQQQNLVLNKGEEMLLEEIGNHNRGTYFYDDSHLITPELEDNINKIASRINGFYYGRFDLKAESVKAFKNGKFKVIELNGINSEPTHIYDKNHTIFSAYKEVFRHLSIMYKISRANMKKGHKPEKPSLFFKEMFDYIF